MSSPIAIPRRASSPAHSESELSTGTGAGLYVPVHKRGASSVSSSASSSSPSPMESWHVQGPHSHSQSHSNAKAAFATTRKMHSHKKSPSSGSASNGEIQSPRSSLEHGLTIISSDASKRTPTPAHTHIPLPSAIPNHFNNTINHNLPFVYSTTDLLALSSSPSLSEEQLAGVRAVAALIPARVVPRPKAKVAGGVDTAKVSSDAAVDAAVADATKTAADKDKSATRRRRVGRARKNTVSQTTVSAAKDVEMRRTRQGHGTWGWNAAGQVLQSHGHEADLEASWRHGPVMVAV